MLLPGPEAMQLATYAGWRLHGVRGGLAAGLLFVAPGALLVLALSILYGAYGHTPPAAALFVGVKAAVLAIVLEALVRLGRRALQGVVDWLVAAAAFVALFFLGLPFPLVIVRGSRRGRVARACICRGVGVFSSRAAGTDAAHYPHLARHMAGAARRHCAALRRRPRAGADRLVLFKARRGDLRRRLRRAGLHGAGGGGRLRVADARRDARRAGPRRDDERAADPGDGVRRLHRRSPLWRRSSRCHGHPRRARHAVGDVRSLLLVDLRRRALHRAADARAAPCRSPEHGHRGRRRRHRQPLGLVRAARAVRAT